MQTGSWTWCNHPLVAGFVDGIFSCFASRCLCLQPIHEGTVPFGCLIEVEVEEVRIWSSGRLLTSLSVLCVVAFRTSHLGHGLDHLCRRCDSKSDVVV